MCLVVRYNKEKGQCRCHLEMGLIHGDEAKLSHNSQNFNHNFKQFNNNKTLQPLSSQNTTTTTQIKEKERRQERTEPPLLNTILR